MDREFVKDIGTNGKSLAIMATTQLSQQLGMKTTAEGVETRQQLDILREQGCTELQGYFIGRPLAADALLKTLNVNERRPVERRVAARRRA